jgi:hypothetical protein
MVKFGIGDLIEYRGQVGEWRSVPVLIYARKIVNGRVVDNNVSCRLEEVTRVVHTAAELKAGAKL